MLTGSNALDPTFKKVLVGVQGGIVGCAYQIKAECATTNAQKTLAKSGILPVLNDWLSRRTSMLLNAKRRAALPTKDFAEGGPKGKKGFPLTDAVHDRMAISGATRSEDAGNISASKAASIKAKARKALRGAKGGGRGRSEHDKWMSDGAD